MATANGPRKVGSFEVVREIGQGGMGVVLLGRQPSLDRPIVLKRLRRDLAAQEEVAARFEREARAAAAVHHQNVVAVYDCFPFRSEHYIAQEYVEGADLRAVLERTGAPTVRVAALIALEVARGLEEIHARGVVHRDLKPANVLIGRSGEVKVADFGIALEAAPDHLTRPGDLLGSPGYMAPEQFEGARADARSDLYAFGLLLYELLAGVAPFAEIDESPDATRLRRMQRERYVALRRRNPAVPRWLARLVRRCLRARPSARPASSAVVRRALEEALGRSSSADARAEIAATLDRAGAFETEEDATRRSPLPEARRAGPVAGWGMALAALVLLVLLDAAWARLAVDPQTPVTAEAAQPLAERR